MYCTLYNNFSPAALKDFIFLLEVKIANKFFQNTHQRQGLKPWEQPENVRFRDHYRREGNHITSWQSSYKNTMILF